MNNDPEAINDLGEITGDSDLPGDATGHAFLWRKGKMLDLGTLPGDYSSYANSINNLSQIVGQSCDINGNCRPFLWENGNMIDLNTLVPASQANLYYPATIDDLGVIGGIAMNQSTGLDPAFVALPTFGLTGKQVSAGRDRGCSQAFYAPRHPFVCAAKAETLGRSSDRNKPIKHEAQPITRRLVAPSPHPAAYAPKEQKHACFADTRPDSSPP